MPPFFLNSVFVKDKSYFTIMIIVKMYRLYTSHHFNYTIIYKQSKKDAGKERFFYKIPCLL